MKLKKLIKKINEENAPPDGWKPEDKATSFLSQCGISYDHKAKNFKMKKQKATSPQAGGPAQ